MESIVVEIEFNLFFQIKGYSNNDERSEQFNTVLNTLSVKKKF